MESVSKVKRVVINFISSMFQNGFVLILSFIASPLILKFLGSEKLGYFKVLNDWIGHIAFLEMTLNAVFIAKLSKVVSAKDESLLNSKLKSAIIQYVKIFLLMLLTGILLFFTIHNFVEIEAKHAKDFYYAYIIIFSCYIIVPFTPFKIVLDVSERSDIINLIYSLQSLVIMSFSVLFAYLSYGITGQAIVLFVSIMLTYSLMVIFAIKIQKIKIIELIKTKIVESSLKEDYKNVGINILINFSHRLYSNSANIIIAYYYSAKSVVPFFFTQRLIHIAVNQVSNIGNASWATVISSYHQNDIKSFKRRFYEVTKIICLANACFLIPIVLWNGDFIILWIGEEHFAGPVLTILAAFTCVSASLNTFWNQVLNGMGLFKEQVIPSIISCLIVLVGGVICTKKYGIIGPLIPVIAGFFLFSSWYYLLLFRKKLDLSIRRLFLSIFPIVISSIFFAYAIYKLKKFLGFDRTWFLVISQMGVCFILMVAVGYFAFLNNAEKEIWRERFFRVWNRAKRIIQ